MQTKKAWHHLYKEWGKHRFKHIAEKDLDGWTESAMAFGAVKEEMSRDHTNAKIESCSFFWTWTTP